MSFRLHQLYKRSASQPKMRRGQAPHCLSQPMTKCSVVIIKKQKVQDLKARFPPFKMVSTMKTVIATFYLSRVRANLMTGHLSRQIFRKVSLTSPKAATETTLSRHMGQKTMQLSLASQLKSQMTTLFRLIGSNSRSITSPR